ncbi:hypothetical protein EVJ58_g1439 [Rhodofomes roseus]|uniref:Uncharacterized protein n=1 Tax=Rhodofomes roseus TaxID=34475 RepID=A0A4Y9Z135_9APHY|nr:hypothetical protein EVJ58_g1439 [Rhodofomes roseus]
MHHSPRNDSFHGRFFRLSPSHESLSSGSPLPNAESNAVHSPAGMPASYYEDLVADAHQHRDSHRHYAHVLLSKETIISPITPETNTRASGTSSSQLQSMRPLDADDELQHTRPSMDHAANEHASEEASLRLVAGVLPQTDDVQKHPNRAAALDSKSHSRVALATERASIKGQRAIQTLQDKCSQLLDWLNEFACHCLVAALKLFFSLLGGLILLLAFVLKHLILGICYNIPPLILGGLICCALCQYDYCLPEKVPPLLPAGACRSVARTPM